ncbi:hypothetical protein Csa_015021 [Cucumis sativus]|uniref:Uncharacterized protein n=1 Tax=Cucumis sativus TaxID=3659 RepID=A0A0A0KYX3_CUCSA|nr:hypothetical protein Csa_015021 [Cucumis sativus]
MVDTAIEKIGILKTPPVKPVELSLCSSALLEEIRRAKMKVDGKDIENPLSKGGVCPTVPSTKVTSMHALSQDFRATSMK